MIYPTLEGGSSVVNPKLALLHLCEFTLYSVLTVVADFLCSYTLIHLTLQTTHLLFQTLNGISSG